MKSSAFFIDSLFCVVAWSCGLMPPRRQYMKEVKNQKIPAWLLNTHWQVEQYEGKAPQCQVVIGFLERGELTIEYNGYLHHGDHLWYQVKADSIVEFQTHPEDKIVWTSDHCGMLPSNFALGIEGDKKVEVRDNRMIVSDDGKDEIVFKKL